MATEALKMMKEQLMSCVQGQLGDISKVDAHELGEAVDMIKDLAEAIYYCTITESMCWIIAIISQRQALPLSSTGSPTSSLYRASESASL